MVVRKVVRTAAVMFSIVAAGLLLNAELNEYAGGILIADAQARVGRPMTPNSVAGVARRTTRRAIRRSTIYVATLPRGCTTVVIEGTSLHHCETTYYQAHGGQYVVVYVD